jgi:hypothetical protein
MEEEYCRNKSKKRKGEIGYWRVQRYREGIGIQKKESEGLEGKWRARVI